VGIGYAATASVLGKLLMWLTPIQPLRDLSGEESVAAAAWFLNALFLYTIFLVFLMWLDALERVQESRSLVAQEASLRAQAEAKALRAQFNPHFVFNTLHSLMLLVRKDPGTAERAIEDVAGLIRYASTLQRREVDQVPLSKELAFARRYLALEKLRLADRLRVEWDVEDGLDDVLVPAFSLQTLLENSIKHGIAPRAEGGTVRIRAALDAEHFTMLVEDNGLGADDGALADNGGSGLQLLRRRLYTVYGDDATIEWAAPPQGGFRVRIAVPERRAPPYQGGAS
jgi:two-component system LytT family sensor kinase